LAYFAGDYSQAVVSPKENLLEFLKQDYLQLDALPITQPTLSKHLRSVETNRGRSVIFDQK